MKSFDAYRLSITPLSPIHIGSGESYEPTNYVINDGVLHEFDTGSVVDALSASDRKALLDIANSRPDTEMIKSVQRYFFERRELLVPWAMNRIPVLPGVANLYASRIGQTANRETDGKQVLNRMEIDRTSYSPVTRQPVLVGSSLKGAIRTALLDGENKGAPLPFLSEKKRKENNQELQQRLFRYRAGNFELDPLRLVQLADAAWSGEAGLPAAQVYLAVNRKKAPVKDEQGRLRKSQAESKELYQILECISPWRYRTFTSQLNLQSVAGLDEKHRSKLPAAVLRFEMAAIARACNAFYKPILEAENRRMRERGYLNDAWDKAVQQLLQITAERMARGQVFLLRVGRHSGAESVTLNGVRNIKIMKGKGQQPEYSDGAKTLWLASEDKDQTSNLLPFGWLLVEVHSITEKPTDWPEFKTACESRLSAARAVAAKLEKRQAEIARVRAEAEAKRREEAEKARLLTEEEARKQREEEEQQARLAAMTPNMRRIEEFKAAFAARAVQLRGGKDKPYTEYHECARKLAKDALEGPDWSAEEKRAAADAIEQWLPKVVQDIDKNQLKKLNLSALRGDA